jgi:SAM-dependent methyltransferase
MKEDQIQKSYDLVAERYSAEFKEEVWQKPFDRGLIDGFAGLLKTEVHPVIDLGCGPGHITQYLAEQKLIMTGVDLSPKMIALAKRTYPNTPFEVGSLLSLHTPAETFSGAIALYSIIHLDQAQRGIAFQEFFRVLRPEGWLLLSFHCGNALFPAGGVLHRDEWWGHSLSLDVYFVPPEEVIEGLRAVGFGIHARVDREPWPVVEYPSQRCYLLVQK